MQAGHHREAGAPEAERFVLVTTMRNEAPFILEWLVYHRLIGFTDILVFTNDCEDGTDLMLDRLAAMGLLTHLPNARRGKKTVQWQALSRASHQGVVKKADWLMVADVDEFLVVKAGDGHLADLLAAVPEPRGFQIPWRMFGASGRVAFDPDLVMAQFTRAAPEALVWPWRAVQFKSLFRNGPHVLGLGVHQPKLDPAARGAWYDANGRPRGPVPGTVTLETTPRYGLAQLNHYALGSAENFLVKAERGRPNRTAEPIGLDYWIDRNFDTVEDDAILRHLPAVRQGVAALLEDPALRALSEAAIAWRRERIEALKLTSDGFYLLARIQQLGGTEVVAMDRQLTLVRELMRMRQAVSTVLRPEDDLRQPKPGATDAARSRKAAV
ncbi:glycosyltransferase family 2 protein [Paracoccus tibetensis]|uniref:Glycosyl transferase family 2 n=1 Tax=Paracoccus tibetensis TaxID=336292 RepID=A0A1G5I0A8_9RHOB|nr:glycosyltransferase family 2 protein [Paracoccus tibetensis]SCY69129.1 Glycosyl transferase family 2 [Paracoccus tibetensis]